MPIASGVVDFLFIIMKSHPITSTQTIGNFVSYDSWLNSINRTRCTGWRWRKEGTVSTQNVFGKLYITRAEINRFETRAMAGEFHKAAITPSRKTEPLSV